MTTKTDIRKLIRGGLTGEEAGKLVFQDNWLADRGKKGLLDKRDIADIKASLKTSRDIKVYNSYIRLYELVDYTLKEANIFALEAQFCQTWEIYTQHRLVMKSYYDSVLLFDMPAIVTQKQYEELSQKQRELKLKQPNTLTEVLKMRANLYGDWEPEEDGFEKWRLAIQEIQKLIREGRLTPLRLKDEQDYRDFNLREIEYLPAEDTLKKLDAWLAGKLSKEEVDSLLEMTVFIGADLYEAGLPEWIKYIETYEPLLFDETVARPDGMMQAQRVAIIQNPEPDEIDERGYWIEKDLFNSKEKPNIEKEKEDIQTFLKAIKINIKGMLTIMTVMDAISQIVGVDLTEDIRDWYKQIEEMVDVFNTAVDELLAYANPWIEDLGLGDYNESYQLKLGKLKPTAKSLRYYEDRMATALGADWRIEAIKNLKYEPAEEGSLAQELEGEIAKLQEKLAKEDIDG